MPDPDPAAPRSGYRPPPPRAVLEGLRQREPKAMGAFFEHYFDPVFGLVMRLLGNRAAAEDVTQEVFYKVYRAAHQLDAAREDPSLMGDQIRRAFDELVRAETQAGPLLLVLEDLHWGDAPTISVIDTALRNLRDRPLFVLAMARPEVDEKLPELWADRKPVRMQLRELGRHAAASLVRGLLSDVEDDRLGLILERAGGNAFYLEELIRAEALGTGERAPDTVLAMVQARLEALVGAEPHDGTALVAERLGNSEARKHVPAGAAGHDHDRTVTHRGSCGRAAVAACAAPSRCASASPARSA